MKYILSRLEQSAGPVLDIGSARYSLEHIFPQNPAEHWPDIMQQDREDLVFQIGNRAILETALNKEAANADFSTKKLIYSRSDIATKRMISDDNLEWDAGRIAVMQKGQAKKATAVWRIVQLS